MKFVRLTNSRRKAIVDNKDFNRVSKFPWMLVNGRYVMGRPYRNADGKRKRMVLLHRFIMRETNPKKQFDHKNTIKLDCRRRNLRPAKRGQNEYNKPKRKGNWSSKFKGVTLRRTRHIGDRWYARVKHNGKNLILGTFGSEILAARAYNRAAKKYYGSFARLNKI
jgi:hypothetical protein